jgi:hypothetical protein
VKIVKIENIVKGEKARLKAAVWYDRNEGLWKIFEGMNRGFWGHSGGRPSHRQRFQMSGATGFECLSIVISIGSGRFWEYFQSLLNIYQGFHDLNDKFYMASQI